MYAIKLPYSLRNVDHFDLKQFFTYKQLRAVANVHTRKPGFIAPGELEAIAKALNISRHTLKKKLDKLIPYNYITKTEYGWHVNSLLSVCDNLNLNYYKKKDGSFSEYQYDPEKAYKRIPFQKFYVKTPDERVLELLHHYTQLFQIARQKKFAAMSNATKCILAFSPEKPMPDRLSLNISLDTQKQYGDYPNTMYVQRLIKELQKVNLLTVEKGKFNPSTLKYECNTMALVHYSEVKWNRLRERELTEYDWKTLLNSVADKERTDAGEHNDLETKFNEYVQRSNQEIKRLKTVNKSKRTRVVKTPTALEQRFIDFVFKKASLILIDKGVMSSIYRTRKITLTMIPNVLAAVLSSKFLRPYFFEEFANSDIDCNQMTGFAFNAFGYVYERLKAFQYDKVGLNEHGTGNYDGRPIKAFKKELNKKNTENYRNYRMDNSPAPDKVLETTLLASI